LEAENMQHGYSSGLDLQVSLYGGCLYMNDGKINQRAVPTISMYLVNTGTPKSSTGDCVEASASYFKTGTLGDDFAAVTNMMDAAFQVANMQHAQEAIQANHELLTHIGVVPARVQEFILAVRELGGAAKTCGAGSITGDKGGVALVVIEDEAALKELCARFHYSLLPVMGETRGVHII
jgi:mevalonate kinase